MSLKYSLQRNETTEPSDSSFVPLQNGANNVKWNQLVLSFHFNLATPKLRRKRKECRKAQTATQVTRAIFQNSNWSAHVESRRSDTSD